MSDDNSQRKGFMDMGRHAARKGTKLKFILTGNEKLDVYLREGYAEGVAKTTSQPAFSTDLFGNKLNKR